MAEAGTIITVVLEGKGWMLKRSFGRYCYRPVGGDYEWRPGLPVAASRDHIEQLFAKEQNHQRFAAQRSNPAYLQWLGKP